MNVIYNIKKSADKLTLEQYFLEIEFWSTNEEFKGKILLILYVYNRKEAFDIHSCILKSLVSEYNFKIKHDGGLINLSLLEVKVKRELDIQVAYSSRTISVIRFETLISSFRMIDVDNIGLDVIYRFESGNAMLITQMLDFIILEDDNDYLSNFNKFRITVNYSFNTHQLDSLLFLNSIGSDKVRSKLNIGDVLYFEERRLIEAKIILDNANVAYSIIRYGSEFDKHVELSITSLK